MALKGSRSDPGLFARKSLEEALAQTEQSGFRRALGPFDLTSIGVAAIIGAGIFVLLGQVARDTGPAITLSILIAGVAAVLSALTYAELASMLPGSGSAYVYAYAALGRLPAFLTGWFILNAYAVGNMTVAIGWSNLFADGLTNLHWGLPEALRHNPAEHGVLNLPAALIMLAVTFLCLPKIRKSTAVNNVLVVLKLAVVLFVIIFGATLVHPSNWTPFTPPGPLLWDQVAAVATGAAILFFAYFGYDTVAATAEESKNPRRDLPLAIVVSVGLCALLYMAMGAVVTGMQAAPTLDPDSPVTAAFRARGFSWASGLIAAGALVGLTTVLYAFQLALSRILYAMARDGFLLDRFARLHPTTGTPWALTLATGILTAVGAALLPLRRAAEMAVLSTIAMYVLVAVGVWVLKAVRPEAPRRFRAHWSVAAGAILLMVGMAALGIRDPKVHLIFALWTGLGLILYGFWGHRRALVASNRGSPTSPKSNRVGSN